MTGSQPADVTIHVRRTPEYMHLEFSALNPKATGFTATLSSKRVDDARKQLDWGLKALKDSLPGLRVEAECLDKTYTALSRLSHLVRSALFGPRNVREGVRKFLAEALPPGSSPEHPPLIEYVGSMDSQIPLEFLPLYFHDEASAISSADDFIRACRAFLGFSCIVRRVFPETPLPKSSIAMTTSPGNQLPVRYLYYEGLRGAKEELTWFTTSAARYVQLEGPYPGAVRDAPGLAEQIFDPSLLLAGGRRTVPDQIQHFACHCYTTAEDPFDNEIELSGNGTSTVATIRDLMADLDRLLDDVGGAPADDMPLIFMNACGASRLRAATTASFPRLFLDNGNRGFIGAEIEMPDEAAAAFSKALYQKFLLHRQPLGSSVLYARNHLLYEYCNPLGISYTTYADPQIHISPASAELDQKDGSNVATAS